MSESSSTLHRQQPVPTRVRDADVPRMMWGDTTSGYVIDWMYPTSDKLHFTMFSLRPGAHWTHSEGFKPAYGADEGFYVLQGSFTLLNPETGEVCVANQGEALHFRKHTWHYGYNFTGEDTIVAEAFAPVPPESEFNMEGLNRAAPPLKRVLGGRYDLFDNWPWNAEQSRQTETMKALPASSWLHVIQGQANPIRVSLFVATDKLTMGRFDLLPGVIADPESHPGDEVALVVEGAVHMRVAGDDNIYELSERDVFFTPAGVEHQYYNLTGQRSVVVFGVAPRFR